MMTPQTVAQITTLTVENCKKMDQFQNTPMDSEFIDIFIKFIVKKKNNQANINSNDVLCKCTYLG